MLYDASKREVSTQIGSNDLVYYEANGIVTSVAALAVKCVATCVECKATFSRPSCFTNSDDVELYPGYLVFKLYDSVDRGEWSCVIRAYFHFPMARCSNPAILRTLCRQLSSVIISAALVMDSIAAVVWQWRIHGGFLVARKPPPWYFF